ncbi:hypothetical protein NEOKW01_0177 [Nematocida sp. AWRm80]|nr:hypothetical protein NEOKW01_0177 [Nematocida sp. AWRm80]
MGAFSEGIQRVKEVFSKGYTKQWITKRINKAMDKMVHPIKEEQLTYSLLKGIVVLEKIKLKPDPIIQSTGLYLENAQIESIVLRMPWYSSDMPTEIEVSGVNISFKDTCVCEPKQKDERDNKREDHSQNRKIQQRCFKCKIHPKPKKESKTSTSSYITRVAHRTVNALIKQLTRHSKCSVDNISITLMTDENIYQVTHSKGQVTKKEEEIEMTLEKTEVSILGTRVSLGTITTTMNDSLISISVAQESIILHIDQLTENAIATTLELATFYLHKDKEDKEDKVDKVDKEPEEDKQTFSERVSEKKNALVHISLSSLSMQIKDIPKLEDIALRIKEIELEITEKYKGSISELSLHYKERELLRTAQTDMYLEDKETESILNLGLHAITGLIQLETLQELLPETIDLHKRITNLINSNRIQRLSKELIYQRESRTDTSLEIKRRTDQERPVRKPLHVLLHQREKASFKLILGCTAIYLSLSQSRITLWHPYICSTMIKLDVSSGQIGTFSPIHLIATLSAEYNKTILVNSCEISIMNGLPTDIAKAIVQIQEKVQSLITKSIHSQQDLISDQNKLDKETQETEEKGIDNTIQSTVQNKSLISFEAPESPRKDPQSITETKASEEENSQLEEYLSVIDISSARISLTLHIPNSTPLVYTLSLVSTSIRALDTQIQRIDLIENTTKTTLLTFSPLRIIHEEVTTIVCTNPEVYIPDDNKIIAIVEEISEVSRIIDQYTDSNTLASTDNSVPNTSSSQSIIEPTTEDRMQNSSEQQSETSTSTTSTNSTNSINKIEPNEFNASDKQSVLLVPETETKGSKPVRIVLNNGKILFNEHPCECIVNVYELVIEIGSTVQITDLKGTIQQKTNVLEIKCDTLVFSQMDRTLKAYFTGSGELSSDLYIFSVNRSLFILDCYTILTESDNEPPKRPLEIEIGAGLEIALKKERATLLKTTAKVSFEMTKQENYFGKAMVTQVKGWSEGEMICSTPSLEVSFKKRSPLTLAVGIVSETVYIADTIGTFIDVFNLFIRVDYRYGLPWVGSEVDLRCKIDQIDMHSQEARILLTDFAMAGTYMQLKASIYLDNSPITKAPVPITIRQMMYSASVMQIGISSVEIAVGNIAQLQQLQRLGQRLHEKQQQKYPGPEKGQTKAECSTIALYLARPPLKIEITQASLILMDILEIFALVRVYAQNRETNEYEILCEGFPVELQSQPQMPIEKKQTTFYSLPFTKTEEDSLFVTFASISTKDTIRIRLSAKMIDSLKASTRKIYLTNLTNRAILAGTIALDPLSSCIISDKDLIRDYHENVLFHTFTPNTTQVIASEDSIFLGSFKEDTVTIRGASNFKNITNSTITIYSSVGRLLLTPFSEISHTDLLTEFSIDVDQCNLEQMHPVKFDVPSDLYADSGITEVNRHRIEYNHSYMTIICLSETLNGNTIVHYLLYHEFILTNLSLRSIPFEIKITSDLNVERITGVVNTGDTKQVSGAIHKDRKRKVRLRLNEDKDIQLHKEDKAKTSLKKGLVAIKEIKHVLIRGQPLDIGMVQITMYPILIAINKTEDDLYLRTDSHINQLLHNTPVEILTSKDRHYLVHENKESAPFSSTVQSNTMFLDLKNVYYKNYLVNIVQGEGSKNKIKYLVIEYANVIENNTGIDLTVITDREFFCGHKTPVPIHFPKKKSIVWICLGTLANYHSTETSKRGQKINPSSDYLVDLENSPEASYLPLEGLKKHLVKLHQKNTPILLAINIHIRNSQRVISIEREEEWPYIIRNQCPVPIQFSQKEYHLVYTLQPQEEIFYYWDSFKAQPAFSITIGEETLLVENFDPVTSNEYKAVLTSNGDKKILSISKKTHEPQPMQVIASQGSLLQIKTGRISVSLLDRDEKEFGCIHFLTTTLAVLFSQNGVEFVVKIESFQLDNQIDRTLYPIPIHMNSAMDAFCFSGWIVNPTTIRYLSTMITPLVIEVEEEYMKKIITHFIPLAEPTENPKYFIRCRVCMAMNCVCTYLQTPSTQSKSISLGYLRIEPVKFKFSFKRAPINSIVPLSSLFCNLTNSKISLPALELTDVYANYLEVLQVLNRTYKKALLKNIVSIVLSVDIVGSPGELFDKLGVGVHDLIYAPYRALDNPALLSKRILSGGKSLAKNVVSGVVDFVGNITGKLSQKLADITMDNDFAELTHETSCTYLDELDMSLPIPKTHLSKAGEKFMGSVISGFKGVMHSPIEGRRSNGLSGMVQGIGKGLVGAIIKPISGAMGLAQGVTTTISGAIQETKPLFRIQLPRAPPLSLPPEEYETERNIYYRAYICLVSTDSKKKDQFITGGIGMNKYAGWHIIITTTKTILYNKTETAEIPGTPTITPAGENTLLTVNKAEIQLEGNRIQREFAKYKGQISKNTLIAQ